VHRLRKKLEPAGVSIRTLRGLDICWANSSRMEEDDIRRCATAW